MTPRLNIILVIALLLVGMPLYWFQFDTGVADAHSRPLFMGELRALAAKMPGQKPVGVRYELVGTRTAIHNDLAAGTGIQPVSAGVRAYQLIVPGERPILIDAGTDAKSARSNALSDYDLQAQQRIDEVARRAELRIALLDKALHTGNPALRTRNGLSGVDLSNASAQAVAPGVVAIPQHDLPDGAMMVYVQLSDGREFLFTGDAAMITESWSELRPPARHFADMRERSRRVTLVSWLKTIKSLKRDAPRMNVIAGHDLGPPRGITRYFVNW